MTLWLAEEFAGDVAEPAIAAVTSVSGIAGVSGVAGVPGVADVPEVPLALVEDHAVVELADVRASQFVDMSPAKLTDRAAIHAVNEPPTDVADCTPTLVVDVVSHWREG